MKKFKPRKAVAILTALTFILSSLAMPAAVFANEPQLNAPAGLVLNRGHVETLAFGGPIGLSWDEVEDAATYTVFAFQGDADEAYAYVSGIDALYLDINTAFDADLTDGPFWFRVQAVADDFAASDLSPAIGPFWNTLHSDEFADNPQGSFAIFENPDVPVLVIDTRRPVERETQGNVVGDVHVIWPNALAVEEGIATHASFQAGVLAAWQNFIANDLTDAQREHLNPDLAYRDIAIFIY
ncbi:MAG: hypothetical protein FWC93_00320 [Defluviitaleaceae bacterium]|nr:hypothetical protein [Defluviitaleaceae bacterium]